MTTDLRRAYFHDMKMPVHVEITRPRAVAAKNIFMGSGLRAGEGSAGAGERAFTVSALGASVFAGADGAGFR